MKTAEFKALCREISEVLGMQDAESLAEEGTIEIDDVDVGLFFEEEVDPETLYCYVDVGSIPQQGRLEMYESLLKLNLLSGSKTRSVFALDPESGHAMLVSHLWAHENADARQIVETLKVYVAQAQALREKFQQGAVPPREELLVMMNSFA
jgi:hypothetical protein